jgi:hypothetical protein
MELQANPVAAQSCLPSADSVISRYEKEGSPSHLATQDSAGTCNAETKPQVYENPPSHYYLDYCSDASSHPISTLPCASRRSYSPAPTTPTTYSFGTLSPTSISSSLQSPPSIAGMSFCHSRESSFGSGMSLRESRAQNSRGGNARAAKGDRCRRRSVSLDLSNRHRRRQIESRDWIHWQQMVSRMEASGHLREFEPKDEDEDLRAYRQGDQPAGRDFTNTDAPTTRSNAITRQVHAIGASLRGLGITVDEDVT